MPASNACAGLRLEFVRLPVRPCTAPEKVSRTLMRSRDQRDRCCPTQWGDSPTVASSKAEWKSNARRQTDSRGKPAAAGEAVGTRNDEELIAHYQHRRACHAKWQGTVDTGAKSKAC